MNPNGSREQLQNLHESRVTTQNSSNPQGFFNSYSSPMQELRAALRVRRESLQGYDERNASNGRENTPANPRT